MLRKLTMVGRTDEGSGNAFPSGVKSAHFTRNAEASLIFRARISG